MVWPKKSPPMKLGAPSGHPHGVFLHDACVYQKAPGEIGFEQWLRYRDKRDDTVEALFQSEIEIGLPYRMQLDIYENWGFRSGWQCGSRQRCL
jgi:hypothetical protein